MRGRVLATRVPRSLSGGFISLPSTFPPISSIFLLSSLSRNTDWYLGLSLTLFWKEPLFFLSFSSAPPSFLLLFLLIFFFFLFHLLSTLLFGRRQIYSPPRVPFVQFLDDGGTHSRRTYSRGCILFMFTFVVLRRWWDTYARERFT